MVNLSGSKTNIHKLHGKDNRSNTFNRNDRINMHSPKSPYKSYATNGMEEYIQTPDGKIYEKLLSYVDLGFRPPYDENDDKLEDFELSQKWKFWKIGPISTNDVALDELYLTELNEVGSFKTARQFWGLYLTIRRPLEFVITDTKFIDIMVFKDGIKPIWEDPTNMNGGRLIIPIKHSVTVTNRLWELIILNIIGGLLDSPELCGTILSIRENRCIIAIWFSSGETNEVQRVREAIMKIFDIEETNIVFQYRNHKFM